MPRKKPRYKLYWIETDDHHEDWFVMARSAREARQYFEEVECYERGDSWSTLVMTLGDEGKTWWPTLDELRSFGFEVLREKTPRVVVYQGVRYAEGGFEHSLRMHDDDLHEARGNGRPNGTERLTIQ